MPKSIARSCSISVFAGIVLVTEALFFHVTKFVLDYVLAMTVISCAVAGIGLGAHLASRLRTPTSELFSWCCGGTTACLYLAAFVLLRHPNLFLLLAATSTVFVFPSLYISTAFARGSGPHVYLFDMLGAGLAVALVVVAYRWLDSEEIFLILVTIIPLLGAVWAGMRTPPDNSRYRSRGYRSLARLNSCLWLVLLSLIGATLLSYQASENCLSIVKLVNPKAPNIPPRSLLRRESRLKVAKTYDNLEGRLDVVPGKLRTYVTYDGFFNDNFTNLPAEDYLAHAKPLGIRYPVSDKRVVYGLVPEPRCFVIGPAATGILKVLRMITPLDHIDAVEINPGILQMMQRDYSQENGGAYDGLQPVLGNALSVLRRSQTQYDIITLINTHSSRWIGALGPPDFLHTKKSYDTYFDHLTQDGYLLFEERPVTRRGELGLKRMILTLCDCLRDRGVADPAKHFFIWEFMSHRYRRQGKTGIGTGNDMYYVGMIVTREPLDGPRKQGVIDWYENRAAIFDRFGFAIWREPEQGVFPAYLESVWHGERFGPFFDMIAAGDFSGVDPGFDATTVTQDRPFPSYSLKRIPEIEQLLLITSLICLGLCVLFGTSALRGEADRRLISNLMLYNFAIGFAYFLVEIVLIQAFHSVFLSPAICLVLVLGVLLIGSALGGLLAGRVSPIAAAVALAPLMLASLRLPDWTITHAWHPLFTAVLGSTVILAIGMTMGIFFPAGLLLAQQRQKRARIPHLFAINSAAGSLATVVSLYLGIRIGYTWTLAIAFVLYLTAAFVLQLGVKRRLETYKW